MKATGIVRRIDDLGRIVVPKELRKMLRIREGDPVEIYTDNQGQIILRKYSPLGEMSERVDTYTSIVAQISGCAVLLTDREHIVSVEGKSKKEYIGRSISKEMEQILEGRVIVDSRKTKKAVEILEGDVIEDIQIICPIICESDVIGALLLLGNEKNKELGEVESKIANIATAFMAQMTM